MKAIRYGIYAIVGLLVLLAGAAIVFVMTFDPNKYKGQIEQLVKEKTGRTLDLKGNLEVALWPSLGAKVAGVALSERDGKEQFVGLDSAHVSVALMPLLHGQAVVDKIRISGLKAQVIKEKDGTFNFSDLLEPKPAAEAGKAPTQESKAPPPAKKDEPREAKKESGQSVAFDIAGVDIDKSAVTYIDRQSGQEIALSDVKLSTGRIAEKADGKLDLKATAKGKNPDIDLKIDVAGGYQFDLKAKSFAVSKLDAKVTGAAAGMTNLNVNAKGDVSANPDKNEYQAKGFSLDLKGTKEKQNLEAHISAPELVVAADKAKGGAITANLKMNDGKQDIAAALKLAGVEGSAKALSIPQLNAYITMAGPDLPNGKVQIPIAGNLKADLEKQTMNADLTSKFDESNIQAKLGLAKFSPPSYLFDVNVDKLNLDRYTGDEKKAAATPKAPPPSEGKAPEKPAPSAQKPEDSPVDLSFLKGLNASGKLAFGALQVKGLKLANVKAEVKAANDRIDVAPHSANLYEGSVTGAISAQADGHVTVKEALNGIAIGPLLRDFAQKDILDGKGNISLDVAAAGKTVSQMKKSLGGTARLALKDGSIKGINIAETIRKAKTALGSQEARAEAKQEQKTDFSEMTASFNIKNGVAHNEDLDVKSPLVRVGGRGDIDIGNGTLDYTTKATVVASTKGQGGADVEQLAGLTVPVHLTGPFDNLKYDVNYAAVAQDALKSKVGEKLKGKLEERLGIAKPEDKSGQGSTSQPDKRQETIDKLKGLLGR